VNTLVELKNWCDENGGMGFFVWIVTMTALSASGFILLLILVDFISSPDEK
jgi:hypothetical protein